MSSLEQKMNANAVSSSKSDPPETDLDYYSRPENYTGSNLHSLQRFKQAKDKELAANRDLGKKKRKRTPFERFARRYKHLLPPELCEGDPESSGDEIEEESEPETTESHKSPKQKTRESKTKRGKSGGTLTIIEEKSGDESTGSAENSRPTSSNTPAKDKLSPTSSNRTGLSKSRETMNKSLEDIGRGSPSDSESGSTSPTKSTKGRQSIVQKARMSSVAKELRSKMLVDKFRRVVMLVRIVLKLSASASENKGNVGMRTFTDIANEADNFADNLKNSGLTFDPSYFKARREINISSEVKTILNSPPESRSADQVQTVMFGLQSLRSFAEYPLHMQEKLAKVAFFEIVPPKRIIIRQGHYAENFYFILSGNAVVTLLLRNPKTGASFVKTATIMRRGMSFGELALLHHSRRTATVTSQDTVQLLSIGREDFFDIFMNASGSDIPEHIKFVFQCEFMKHWPVDKLVENPEQCLLHFFKRNVVIVKDSRVSEWIYVVKSGSCQVLKELRGVMAGTGYRKPSLVEEQLTLPNILMPKAKIDTGLKQKVKISRNRSNRSSPTKTEPPKDAKNGPVFIQVENLEPKEAFGLTTIQFDDDVERPSTVVSLVSRGAECVMVSKAFFAKHANDNVKRQIRHQIRTYPDEETFQENLQIKVDWEEYRVSLINDLTSQL